MFSLKQLALSVRHILHPRLAVVINPSQHYKVKAPFPFLQQYNIFSYLKNMSIIIILN